MTRAATVAAFRTALRNEQDLRKERSAVAALRLHQEFVAAEPKRMRQSLHAAVDVLTGTVPGDAPADAVLSETLRRHRLLRLAPRGRQMMEQDLAPLA